MAVRLVDTIEQMKAVVADGARSPWQRSEKVLELAASFMVAAIARDPERGQVGILMRIPDAPMLTFAYPSHLSEGNTLPLDQNSVAGRVFLGRTVAIENQLKRESHKDFFERIPNERGAVRPIQKMVAAPILVSDGEAIGVAEVSRTGSTLATAGPDFTPQDAENLLKTCRAFAPFVARTWTRDRGWEREV